jgi:hypothetical protein
MATPKDTGIANAKHTKRSSKGRASTSDTYPSSPHTSRAGADSNESLKKYRDDLLQGEQKSQEDFDKTVISLSSGALAFSMAFVKNIAGEPPYSASWSFLCAWLCWTASLIVVLVSFFLSVYAFRLTLSQIDKQTIYQEKPGKRVSTIVECLNVLGGIFFLTGIVLMALFIWRNMEFE